MRRRVTRHFTQAQLLDEQQTVGVVPVLGDLSADDAQGVSTRERDFAADRAR